MRTARVVGVVLCGLLAAAACDEGGPAGPTVPLRQRFTLAPGQGATVESDLFVQFLRVSGDSRCPADVVCIQGGDAIVHVRVSGPSTQVDYELHTGGPPSSAVTPTGLRIELLDLQPYPFSSRVIRPGDYRATFVASR